MPMLPLLTTDKPMQCEYKFSLFFSLIILRLGLDHCRSHNIQYLLLFVFHPEIYFYKSPRMAMAGNKLKECCADEESWGFGSDISTIGEDDADEWMEPEWG